MDSTEDPVDSRQVKGDKDDEAFHAGEAAACMFIQMCFLFIASGLVWVGV